LQSLFLRRLSLFAPLVVAFVVLLMAPVHGLAQEPPSGGGEQSLVLPNFNQDIIVAGMTGQTLLSFGLIICVLGLLFGFVTYRQLRDLPVHHSMRAVSELIWET